MGSSEERRHYIQRLIAQGDNVQVGSLAKQLDVSEMTIRRDLAELERIGILRKVHGGAIKETSRSFEPPFSIRMHNNSLGKELVAREALSFLSEGDTVAIDTGSTALAFAKLLQPYHELTIVTPSVHIALLFLHHPSIRVFLSGGELRKHEGSLVGDQSRRFFENLHFDTFFMSSAALSVDGGLTEYVLDDASIKHLIIEHAKKTIALMTGEKFGKTAFAQVCSLNELDTMITDTEPDGDIWNTLQTHGVRIILAHAQRGDTI